MIAAATAWERLVSTVLVGTERRPVPGAVDEIAALLGGELGRAGAEQALLIAAGALAAYRRAGFPVDHDPGPAPPPAGPDERPAAPARAADLLGLLLGGQLPVMGGPVPLVGAWLDRCRATGHRVPYRFLPELLELALRAPELRPGLTAAGGARLSWLAARNLRWAWASAPAPEFPDRDAAETWERADRGARFTLLRRLRETRSPQALVLVRRTWRGEKAADRAEILETLRAGLSQDDEDFLEAALDDRAAPVRRLAAELLSALPSSRLAARMAGRLRPLMSLRGRPKRLHVELPEEPDAAARRDGITDRRSPRGLGRRSWWLLQLAAAAPLSSWTDGLGTTPDQLIGLAEQPELLDGWALAAARQQDSYWAAALLRSRRNPNDPALLDVLPPHEAPDVLAALLSARPDADLAPLLAAVSRPWSPSLTRAVATRIVAARSRSTLAECLPLLAAADPSVAGDLEDWLAGAADSEHRRRLVHHTVSALSLRRAIAEAFS